MVLVLFLYQEMICSIIDRYFNCQRAVKCGPSSLIQKMNYSKASGTVKWNTSGGGQPQVKAFTQENFIILKKVCQATLSSILEIIVNSLIKSITAHDFINDRLELVDSIGHCSPL